MRIHEAYEQSLERLEPGMNLGGSARPDLIKDGDIVTYDGKDYIYDPELRVEGVHYVRNTSLSWWHPLAPGSSVGTELS